MEFRDCGARSVGRRRNMKEKGWRGACGLAWVKWEWLGGKNAGKLPFLCQDEPALRGATAGVLCRLLVSKSGGGDGMRERGWRRWGRGFWRSSEYYARMDVSALGGVGIVLFIVMIVVQSPGCVRSSGPELPRVLHAWALRGAAREDAMNLAISRDGRYFFGGTQIVVGEVADRVRAGVRSGAERRVYLKVDRRARYSQVAGVADGIRRGGVERISFLTE